MRGRGRRGRGSPGLRGHGRRGRHGGEQSGGDHTDAQDPAPFAPGDAPLGGGRPSPGGVHRGTRAAVPPAPVRRRCHMTHERVRPSI
ncbi:hypothetical protein CA984_09675 [Streptosporangium minutum]|uniref:Uncharacterized protein n=1 Tax=Streptosporangium minutum TaxID=569862 RepID=A0A243RTR8_9ACTN|nr:hypothetical protein CA984_09675 [Streptosporangium minutum]